MKEQKWDKCKTINSTLDIKKNPPGLGEHEKKLHTHTSIQYPELRIEPRTLEIPCEVAIVLRTTMGRGWSLEAQLKGSNRCLWTHAATSFTRIPVISLRISRWLNEQVCYHWNAGCIPAYLSKGKKKTLPNVHLLSQFLTELHNLQYWLASLFYWHRLPHLHSLSRHCKMWT